MWVLSGTMVGTFRKSAGADSLVIYNPDVTRKAVFQPALDFDARLPSMERLVLTQAHVLLKARQPLSLTQKRLVSIGIAVQRMTDVDLRLIRLYVQDYMKVYGIVANAAHQTFSENVKGLLDQKVFLDLGDNSFRGYNWVTESAYIGQRRSANGMAYGEYSLNPVLKPYLLQLDGHFQSYALEDTKDMTLPSWRLYEILLADTFDFSTARTSVTYDVDNLKMILNCSEYSWRDFRRDIIERAQAEHQHQLGLNWEYERITRGRKVIGVELIIRDARNWSRRKDKKALHDGELSQTDLEHVTLKNELATINFSADITPFLQELGIEHVRNILKKCWQLKRERDVTRGATPIDNLAGFFHQQLKRALEGSPSVAVPEKASGSGLSREARSRIVMTLMGELRRERLLHATALIQTYGNDKKKRIHDAVETTIDSFRNEIWISQGHDPQAVLPEWARWSSRLYPEDYPQHLLTVDAYVMYEQAFAEFSERDRDLVMQEAREADPWHDDTASFANA